MIPIAFSPFGQGPLREVGWKVELAWLPASALVSSVALYRAHARRRAKLEGRPPRGRRRLTPASYRARVGLAAGAIALLLVSLPFVPAVAGIGSSPVRYTFERHFTRDVTGQFLVTPRGPVKLFSWGDPQASYPSDALRLRSGDVHSLLVRAPQVDAPAAYQLYDLVRGGSIPLLLHRSSIAQKATSVSPVKPVLPLFDEPANVIALGLPVPRLRMKFEPIFLLLPPLLKKSLWNGISETKGDKICRLRLFTMRQIASTLHHLAMRVEAVECDCASRMLARRNRLEACVTRRLLANHRHVRA